MDGLLPYEARPSPFEQAQLACQFGFQEVTVPQHGHQERPVLVLRSRVVGGPNLPAGLKSSS